MAQISGWRQQDWAAVYQDGSGQWLQLQEAGTEAVDESGASQATDESGVYGGRVSVPPPPVQAYVAPPVTERAPPPMNEWRTSQVAAPPVAAPSPPPVAVPPPPAEAIAAALAVSNYVTALAAGPFMSPGVGDAWAAAAASLAAASPAAASPVSAPPPPAAPTASPDQIALLELLLGDSMVREVVAAYSPAVPAGLPTNATTEALVEQYGQDLTGRLMQASNAIVGVLDAYLHAMDQAAVQGPGGSGWVLVAGTTGEGQGDNGGTPDTWHFDTVRFTADYAKGSSLAARAFAAIEGDDGSFAKITRTVCGTTDAGELYASSTGGIDIDSAQFKVYDTGDASGELRWDNARIDRTVLTQVDLSAPPEMFDPKAVWFDPTRGFVTPSENIVPESEVVQAVVMTVIVGVVTWGIGSTICGAYGLATTGMAGGAILGATGAVVGGLFNGHLSFEDVVRGAVTGAIMGALTENLNKVGVDPKTGAVTDWGARLGAIGGKATVQGILSELTGGEFKDGFGSTFVAGLAGEISRSINASIDEAIGRNELNAEQAKAYRMLGRAATTAFTALGHPDDPLASFAENFLGDVLKAEIPVPASSSAGSSGTGGQATSTAHTSASAGDRNGLDVQSDQFAQDAGDVYSGLGGASLDVDGMASENTASAEDKGGDESGVSSNATGTASTSTAEADTATGADNDLAVSAGTGLEKSVSVVDEGSDKNAGLVASEQAEGVDALASGTAGPGTSTETTHDDDGSTAQSDSTETGNSSNENSVEDVGQVVIDESGRPLDSLVGALDVSVIDAAIDMMDVMASQGLAEDDADQDDSNQPLPSEAGQSAEPPGSVIAHKESTNDADQGTGSELQTLDGLRAQEHAGKSVSGIGYVARGDDSISKILGTSDPQAIGNFMRANGLTNSTILAGKMYFVPDDRYAYGDSSGLGQQALQTDNARLAQPQISNDSFTVASGNLFDPHPGSFAALSAAQTSMLSPAGATAGDYLAFTAGTVGNILLSAGAGVSGLATLLLTGDAEAAAHVTTSIQEQYSWRPSTPGQRDIGTSLVQSEVIQIFTDLKQSTGDYYAKYGPLAGTAGYMAPDVLLTLLAPYASRLTAAGFVTTADLTLDLVNTLRTAAAWDNATLGAVPGYVASAGTAVVRAGGATEAAVGEAGGLAGGSMSAEDAALSSTGGASRQPASWETLNVRSQTELVQSGETSCGQACAATMARQMGYETNEAAFIENLGAETTQADVLARELTSQTGRRFQGGTIPDIPSALSEGEVIKYVQSLTQGGERPFMALLNAPGNLGDGHWVVVQGMNGAGKISVLDPAGLSYEMSVSGFRNAWVSGALVF